MKIRKAFQGTIPDNKILDTYSTSQTDTYSCNLVNNLIKTTNYTINIGSVGGNGEKLNETYTLTNIPSGYTFIGILGWNLQGNMFTRFIVTQLIKASDTTITWGVRNTSGTATNDLTLTFTALFIKTS